MKTVESSTTEEVRQAVRERYGAAAAGGGCGCGPSSSGCCSGEGTATEATRLGYSEEQVQAYPEGAEASLGCGNPLAIASLRSGQTVLDLGSGAGFDCFLAAGQVGPTGRVIGVDMTSEMIAKARANAARRGFRNVEFREGEIERLPVDDNSVDVILSNCVINLSPDKPAVFREAFRVLRSGGRLAVSDVVATAPLPEGIRASWEAYTGCMSGALEITQLEALLRAAGFREIRIRPKSASRELISEWLPGRKVEEYLVSASIEAVKP